MKKILIFLALSFTVICNAQNTENFYITQAKMQAYYDSILAANGWTTYDSLDEYGYGGFKSWEYMWEPRLYPTGDFDAYHQNLLNNLQEFLQGDAGFVSDPDFFEWNEIGPNDSPEGKGYISAGTGRAMYLYFDPNDYSQNTIFVGAAMGGLWRSTDNGGHWINAGTDKGMPNIAISSVTVDINDSENHWFVTTGDDNYWQPSIGVWRTLDAGNTWEMIGLESLINTRKVITVPGPGAHLLVTTNQGVYECLNALADEPVWNLLVEGKFIDIELKPDDNTIAYASGAKATTVLTIDLDDPSQTQELQDTSFLDNSHNYNLDNRQISIEISNGAPNLLFIVVSVKDTSYSQLFKYDLSSDFWVDKGILPEQVNGGGGTAGISTGSILAWKVTPELTPSDELMMAYGSTAPLNISGNLLDDNLCNWNSIAHYNNPIHPDYRFMTFDNYRNLWVCTDGGIYTTTILNNPAEHWQRKNNGLAIATVYSVATSELDRNIVLSGQHDGGTNIYKPISQNDWSERWVFGGDGSKPLCDFTDINIMYGSSQYQIARSTNHGDSFNSYTTPSGATFGLYFTYDYADPSILYIRGNSYTKGNPGWNANKWGLKKLVNGSWERIEKFEDQFSFITNTPYADPSVHCVETTPADPDYIYVSWVGNDFYQTGLKQHIFKTTVGGGQGPNDWIDVGESPIVGWLTDIAIDDDNPDHIYVAASAWNQSVVYSIDYDETGQYLWTPLNSNFDFNVNTIVFDRESTNHTIYVGTDNGLFYTDDQLTDWVNVTGELPNTYIYDLEINYNKESLTVGTFGRGVWEAALPVCNKFETPYVVTENETWDTDREIYSDVIVESGVSLTIQATVKFVPEASLIVKRGGQLGIDGGILTNSCSDMWQGIEVWGDPTKPDNLPYQGQVTLRNATVKNAITGIKTIKIVHDEQKGDYADMKFAGGIIKALNSYFVDNETSVRFYKYPFDGYTYSSASYFTNCQFITDGLYFTEYDEPVFVKMSGINTVRFNYCTFDNQTPVNQFGIGIHSFDSKFFVQGQKTGDQWNNGLFQNLNEGIYAIVSGSEYYADIQHTSFVNNHKGIYIGSMTGATITDNNFEINSPWSDNEGGYGLYLDRSTAYKVEENNFFHDGTSRTGVGLIVNESGTQPNEIYRNWFTNLECGMDIQGENRDKNGEGLQLRCNQYSGTVMDKVITWDLPVVNSYAGIATNQGSASSSAQDMAGNLFQIDSENPNDDFDDILNEANHITYYWPLNNNDIRVKPVDYTESTVTLEGKIVGSQWTFENGCPPSEEGGGGGTGTGESLRSSIAQSDQKIDSTETLLALLIDGGNTEATQTGVDNSVPSETMQVYTELMNKSPYLSDTVISTAIEKEDVLPGVMIRDIMVANPKAAKSEKLILKLDQRWNPLPEYMKAQILTGRSIVSIREETESRHTAFKLQRAKYFNSLVKYYMKDTVNPAASADSLVSLLENEHDLKAKYLLSFIDAKQGDWDAGFDVLNAVPTQFDFEAEQSLLHTQMTTYYQLLHGLAQQGKSPLQADSNDITVLENIEQADAGEISAYARNILWALNEIEYNEPVLVPDVMKSTSVAAAYGEIMKKVAEAPHILSVKPIPAKDFVIIEYCFDLDTEATVEIFDMNGNVKYEKCISGKQDALTVDTGKWKAGVFLAILKINGKTIENVKFTVVN